MTEEQAKIIQALLTEIAERMSRIVDELRVRCDRVERHGLPAEAPSVRKSRQAQHDPDANRHQDRGTTTGVPGLETPRRGHRRSTKSSRCAFRLVELTTSHARTQFDTLTAQAKELQAIVQKAMPAMPKMGGPG